MPSSYPGSLDNFATDKTNSTLLVGDHPGHHNDLAAAINQVEAELGVTPSGSEATVAARLDALAVSGGSTGVINIEEYGASTSSANNTVEIQAALTAANGGKTVIVPPGNYNCTGQLDARDCTLQGFGWASKLTCTASLGADVPFIRMRNGSMQYGRTKQIRDLQIQGPGYAGSPALGVKQNVGDGVKAENGGFLFNVLIQHFDHGIVNASNHLTVMGCMVGACYGSVHYTGQYSSGDNWYVDSDLTGSCMASIVVHPDGYSPYFNSSISGDSFLRTHFGSCPFGIFRAAGGSATFMLSVDFIRCAFENLGNAAIYCADTDATTASVLIRSPGVIFVPGTDLGTYPHDYSFVFGNHTGGCGLEFQEVANSQSGAKGFLYVAGNSGHIISDTPIQITIPPGNYDNTVHFRNKDVNFDHDYSIGAGSTSAEVKLTGASRYSGPVNSVRPIVTATSTAGLVGASLYVTNVASEFGASTPGAATVALSGTGAGNVDNGTHSYKITFETAMGETTGGTTSAQVNVTDKTTNGKVALTNIPVAGSHQNVIARNVYRRVAGDTGNHKLVARIADNTTTTYTDNTADASLGVDVPTSDGSSGTKFTVNVSGGTPSGTSLDFNYRIGI